VPASSGEGPTVAIVAAGNVLEDSLEPLGISFDEFLSDVHGGWMFNYVEALQLAGLRPVVVCHTEHVRAPERFVHRPTGATVWGLPPGGRLDELRALQRDPPPGGKRDPTSVARAVWRNLATFSVTPPRALLRALRQEKSAAVVSQDYEDSRFDACVAIARLLRIPAFATFQGGPGHASYFGRYITPLTLRAAAGLVVAAQTEIDRLQQTYGLPDEKLAKIPNPLDTGEWRPADRARARTELGIPPDARVAISHGRIDIDDKGLDVMLEAWRRVAAERPDADLRLVLVGSGGDSDRLRAVLAEQRHRGAELRDFVIDHDVLRTHLSAADVFVFAGRYEGFPVAPTEAMACGLPVVATAASGVPDLFERDSEDGGLVVPIDDVDALARELGRLIDDPEQARELGARARRRVENYCAFEVVAERLSAFMRARGLSG